MATFQPANSCFGQDLFPRPPAAVVRGMHAINNWQISAKRSFDVVMASVALMVLALPMLIIAILIRAESPGRAIFRQNRIGFANRPFEMWKFRTMYQNEAEPTRLTQTLRADPRVTRVGAFLRHTSLDELPQLFNVLRGEMSLVGPRPHAPGTCAGDTPFELVTRRYAARHCVRPGMTGLAQVRGLRGATETESKLLSRLAADLEYIETWSLSLDFIILVRTFVSVAALRNAY